MNIDFVLPANSNVIIDICNIREQHIKSLANHDYPTGTHSVNWAGTDKNKNQVANGVYFYQMKTDDEISSRKMLVIR